MIDIKLIRENKDLVKENIKKKFQDEKLPLVDEVFDLDKKVRDVQVRVDTLKADKNKLSGEIGKLMKDGKKDEADAIKKQIAESAEEITKLEAEQAELGAVIKEKMMVIPQIIDDSVPVGKDDTENVEVERFGDPVVPKYEIPYHADIIEALNGMDKDAAGRTSGQGFYYLMGDIARLHEAMIAYRDTHRHGSPHPKPNGTRQASVRGNAALDRLLQRIEIRERRAKPSPTTW